jgi:4-aminobutyrate aminotransferase
MAKAIGGGLPLGVTLAKEELMRWHVGAHASTFGGNPVAIAAALKTFEILEKGVMKNAAEMGSYMMDRLRELQDKHPAIVQVRGLGLMIGVDIARDREASELWTELRDEVVVGCFNRGLVIQGAGESAVRFSPPLIVDREQVDFAVKTFEAVLQKAS